MAKANIKKTIIKEGLIFLALFGVSYLVYLVIRLSAWLKKRPKAVQPEQPSGS